MAAYRCTQEGCCVNPRSQPSLPRAVYLNGVEASRRENMPTGNILASTTALAPKNPPTESGFVTAPMYWAANVLKAGENIVTVSGGCRLPCRALCAVHPCLRCVLHCCAPLLVLRLPQCTKSL